MLISDFILSNFKTVICSANAALLSETVMGKTLDDNFFDQLSPDTDPCGERGEFHTFVYDGPIFKKPIGFEVGEVVKKVYHYKKLNPDGSEAKLESAFWFQDLLPRMKA
jgi:diphthamide synthase (EF-2-diphthine--ammonia ligase)